MVTHNRPLPRGCCSVPALPPQLQSRPSPSRTLLTHLTLGAPCSCSKAKCPSGDYSRREGLNEVQRVNCTATNGSFIMWFRGMPSAPIYFNSTKEVFKQKLEDMRS